MNNIREFLGIRNARIGELCGVKKELDERIDEGVLRWFSHMERMESDRIVKSLCRGRERVCW